MADSIVNMYTVINKELEQRILTLTVLKLVMKTGEANLVVTKQSSLKMSAMKKEIAIFFIGQRARGWSQM